MMPTLSDANNTTQKKKRGHVIYYATTHSQISEVIGEFRKTNYHVPIAVLDWDVDNLAAQAGFELVASEPFEQKDFPGYHPKHGCGKTPDGPFRLNDARTLVCKLLKTDD
nr:fanconi anemia group J protein homolog isoform X3 [Tanacetum cinerariifolium]